MAKITLAITALAASFGCSIATGGTQLLPPDRDGGPAVDDAAEFVDAIAPMPDSRTMSPADAGRDARRAEDGGADAGTPLGHVCENPIDITGSGTFEGTTCDGEDDLVDCSGGPPAAGTGEGPREVWFTYSGGGPEWSASFSVTPGFRLILGGAACEALSCTRTHTIRTSSSLYLGVEREAGGCGDFVLTVDPA